jgi:hypothetical protein
MRRCGIASSVVFLTPPIALFLYLLLRLFLHARP